MTKAKSITKKVFAMVCILTLIAVQILVLMPEIAFGATAGSTLSVRVQYFGDRGDKVKEKASFSRNQLAGMGASTYCYSNVTNVGTVMVMKAYGPKVTTIISNAGIDLNSVQNITFRTTDGYTRNFSASQIGGTAFYYPNLNLYTKVEPNNPTDPTEPIKPTTPTEPTEPTQPTEPSNPTDNEGENTGIFKLFEPVYAADGEWILNYDRSKDGRTLTPRKGSLKGATRVPAILALQFGSTKQPGHNASDLSMGTKETYRFCLGQSKLTEGKQTNPGYGGGDVSSADSCHSIYGIDVTLYGSPIKGVGLSIRNSKLKVGSKERIAAIIKGDKLFKEYLSTGTLKWKSSDKSIATVDQNGVVTIHKTKAVTITATAMDGTSGSITINGDDGGVKAERKEKVKSPNTMVVREISIGEKITEDNKTEDNSAQSKQSETQTLEKTEEYDSRVVGGSAIGAALACGCGAAFRIRRFRMNR